MYAQMEVLYRAAQLIHRRRAPRPHIIFGPAQFLIQNYTTQSHDTWAQSRDRQPIPCSGNGGYSVCRSQAQPIHYSKT